MTSWTLLLAIAEGLARAYDPGDGTPGRCDVDLLVQGLVAAQRALESEPAPLGKEAPHEAVASFVGVLLAVARGLAGDLRDAAEGARDVAEDLERLRGPAA